MAAALCTAAAAGQTLSTEVVVDRTVRPAERAANRPDGLTPLMTLPGAAPVALGTAAYTGVADIIGSYRPLQPIQWPALPQISDYRGYLSAGYFPTYNLGISAGYRVLNSDRTRLSVYGQFDGENYKLDDASIFFNKAKSNIGRIGADFHMAIGPSSHLLASLSGGYAKSSYADLSQSLFDVDLSTAWISRAGRLHYRVAIDADIDAYGKLNGEDYYIPDVPGIPEPSKISQQHYALNAGAAYDLGAAFAGLDVDAAMLVTSEGDLSQSLEKVNLTPFVAYRNNTVDIRAGVRGGFLMGADGGSFGLMPDVRLTWSPAGVISIYGTFTGDTRLNPISSLRQYSPYVFASRSYAASRCKFDGEVGINVGSLGGFSMRLFGNYAVADDWLMPEGPDFSPYDIKGWRAGVELGYQFRRLFHVKAGIQAAPSKENRAYYRWIDRAKYVINASADVRPVDHLTLGVKYTFRGGRHAFHGYVDESLGCISQLDFRGDFAVTPALNVFADVENLLCRRWYVLPGIRSKKLAGLIGLTLKF